MKILNYFPGVILSAVIAMFIGMLLNGVLRSTKLFSSGIKFISKKLLKLAIILLGLSLNIKTVAVEMCMGIV